MRRRPPREPGSSRSVSRLAFENLRGKFTVEVYRRASDDRFWIDQAFRVRAAGLARRPETFLRKLTGDTIQVVMPRPRKISRQNVLDAASRLVALEGLSALSMRGIGKDLGVEAMSLYKYVGRREDLVALLRAELFASIPLPCPVKNPRRDLEAVCTAVFRGLVGAPGGASLAPPLPRLSPPGSSAATPKIHPGDLDEPPESGVMRGSEAAERAELIPLKAAPWLPIVERVLSSLRALIPEPLDRAYAAHTLLSFVLGQVVFGGAAGGLLGERLEGTTSLSADFPEVQAIMGALQNRSPEVEFDLGLRVLLDAMEARRGF